MGDAEMSRNNEALNKIHINTLFNYGTMEDNMFKNPNL